jgi:hypothetical protein
MYGYVEGYIVPCQWGIRQKVMGHILFNDDNDDIVIRADAVPAEIIDKGLKVRLTGNIVSVNGFKEILVERINVLESTEHERKKLLE